MIVTPRWAWPKEPQPIGILVIRKKLTEAEKEEIRQRWLAGQYGPIRVLDD